MRPFRLRVAAAIVLAVLMLGSLGSVANADETSTSRFTFGPEKAQPVPTSFPEDPWPGLWVRTSFPEDPWPGLVHAIRSFPEDPWPGLSN